MRYQVSSRKSADNMEIPNEDQLRCCWCLEVDDSSNLRAFGQQWASKNPTKKEKKEKARQIAAITAEWKKIAAVMEHDYVLCKLMGGDVGSNELFYHN